MGASGSSGELVGMVVQYKKAGHAIEEWVPDLEGATLLHAEPPTGAGVASTGNGGADDDLDASDHEAAEVEDQPGTKALVPHHFKFTLHPTTGLPRMQYKIYSHDKCWRPTKQDR